MADSNYIIKGYVKNQAEIDAIENPQEGWVVIAEEAFGNYVEGTEILYTEKFGWGLNSLTTPLQFRAWVAANFYNKNYIDGHLVDKKNEGKLKISTEDKTADYLLEKLRLGKGLSYKVETKDDGSLIYKLLGNSTFSLKAFTGHYNLSFNPKTATYDKFNMIFEKDSGNIDQYDDGRLKLSKNIYLIFANFGFNFPGYQTNYEGLKVTIGARIGDQVIDEFSYVLDTTVSDHTIEYSIGELPDIEVGFTNFNLTLTVEDKSNFGPNSPLTECNMHARMYVIGPAE